MSRVLEALRNDHRNYSRLLALLKSDIDILQHSEDPDFIRLYDIMNYMTNYPDVSHHPVEEIIFAALEPKAPGSTEQIKQQNSEHHQINKLGMSLKEKLQHVTSGSIVSRDSIINAANDYYQLLINHINIEEGQLFPIVENVFTKEDWSLLDLQINDLEDPLFGDAVQEQFTNLYARITIE